MSGAIRACAMPRASCPHVIALSALAGPLRLGHPTMVYDRGARRIGVIFVQP